MCIDCRHRAQVIFPSRFLRACARTFNKNSLPGSGRPLPSSPLTRFSLTDTYWVRSCEKDHNAGGGTFRWLSCGTGLSIGTRTTGDAQPLAAIPNRTFSSPLARPARPSTRSTRPSASATPATRSSPASTSRWPPTRSRGVGRHVRGRTPQAAQGLAGRPPLAARRHLNLHHGRRHRRRRHTARRCCGHRGARTGTEMETRVPPPSATGSMEIVPSN